MRTSKTYLGHEVFIQSGAFANGDTPVFEDGRIFSNEGKMTGSSLSGTGTTYTVTTQHR